MFFESIAHARKSIDRRGFQRIHETALQAAKNLKRAETEMIKALQEVDRSKTYRHLGYDSLFTYAKDALLLSEAQAYTFISVARKARELPALQSAIDAGEITINKARRLASVIDERNQHAWLELACSVSQRELEKQIAIENPRLSVPESIRYIADRVLELNASISEETLQLLNEVRDLLRQKTKSSVSLDETIRETCTVYLDRHDPLRKARRATLRAQKKAVRLEKLGTCQNEVAFVPDPSNTPEDSRIFDEEGIEREANKDANEAGYYEAAISEAVSNNAPVTEPVRKNAAGDNLLTNKLSTHKPTAREAAANTAVADSAAVDEAIGNRTATNGFPTNNTAVSDSLIMKPAASKSSTTNATPTKPIPNKHNSSKRKPIPASVQNAVLLRDGNRCTARDASGERCSSRMFLEFHHLTPVSCGGLDTLENLTLLCFHHHRAWHERGGESDSNGNDGWLK